MISMAPYSNGDEIGLNARDNDDWGVNEEGIRIMISQYPAWTFRDNDHAIVMLMGIWKLWDGNWECWAMPTDRARGHGYALVRRTKELLDKLSLRPDIKRFTALSREDKIEYNKWLLMIGFELEYVQDRAYDGKLDVLGFRRLANERFV